MVAGFKMSVWYKSLKDSKEEYNIIQSLLREQEMVHRVHMNGHLQTLLSALEKGNWSSGKKNVFFFV